MKKNNNFIVLIIVVIFLSNLIIINGCKKDEDAVVPDNTEKEQFSAKEFSGEAESNGVLYEIIDTLGYKYYFYGKYNSSGQPDTISSISAFNKTNDSIVNFFFDNQQRIEMFYVSFPDGSKDTVIHTLDYFSEDSLTYSAYSINWSDGAKSLLHSEDVLIPNLKSLKSTNPFTTTLVDALNTVVGVGAVVGIGVIGATISTPMAVAGVAVVAVAWLAGDMSHANASDVIPNEIPPSPEPVEFPKIIFLSKTLESYNPETGKAIFRVTVKFSIPENTTMSYLKIYYKFLTNEFNVSGSWNEYLTNMSDNTYSYSTWYQWGSTTTCQVREKLIAYTTTGLATNKIYIYFSKPSK